MKSHIAHETAVQLKLGATTVASAGVSISELNEVITFVAGCLAIIVGCITIYRFIREILAKRNNK